jgi:hypothetical protein
MDRSENTLRLIGPKDADPQPSARTRILSNHHPDRAASFLVPEVARSIPPGSLDLIWAHVPSSELVDIVFVPFEARRCGWMAHLASRNTVHYSCHADALQTIPQAAMMRLTTFLVADHAEAVKGKLYVTGGCWNQINVSQLPTTHPHLTVAAALHVPWQATNQQHTLQLDLVDADHHSLLPETLQGSFETGRPPGMRSGDEAVVVIAFNFNSLQLNTAGTHEFVLEVDGTELGRIGFKVMVSEPVTSTGQ